MSRKRRRSIRQGVILGAMHPAQRARQQLSAAPQQDATPREPVFPVHGQRLGGGTLAWSNEQVDPNARANSRRFRTEREQDRLHELAMAMVKEELAEPDASQQAMEFLRSRGHTGASATALWRDAQLRAKRDRAQEQIIEKKAAEEAKLEAHKRKKQEEFLQLHARQAEERRREEEEREKRAEQLRAQVRTFRAFLMDAESQRALHELEKTSGEAVVRAVLEKEHNIGPEFLDKAMVKIRKAGSGQ